VPGGSAQRARAAGAMAAAAQAPWRRERGFASRSEPARQRARWGAARAVARFPGHAHAWQAVLAALPNHGPVWCPWLPGHGPAARLHRRPGRLRCWRWPTALPAGAVLAGYSMGARLALAAALQPGTGAARHAAGRRPRRVGDGGRARRARGAGRAARKLPCAPALTVVRRRLGSHAALRHAACPAVKQAQAQQRQARLAHDAQALAWAFEVAGLACMPDLRAAVAARGSPALAHRCAGHTLHRAGRVARAPALGHHRSVAGAGHNLLLEAPADVAASLAACMEKA
jgi:2-succinyl-6-hydroxy-2,4-cyclohexadiene-1-carboxylate synthase